MRSYIKTTNIRVHFEKVLILNNKHE